MCDFLALVCILWYITKLKSTASIELLSQRRRISYHFIIIDFRMSEGPSSPESLNLAWIQPGYSFGFLRLLAARNSLRVTAGRPLTSCPVNAKTTNESQRRATQLLGTCPLCCVGYLDAGAVQVGHSFSAIPAASQRLGHRWLGIVRLVTSSLFQNLCFRVGS